MSGNGPKPGGAPFSPGSGFGGGMSGLSEQGDAAALNKALTMLR